MNEPERSPAPTSESVEASKSILTMASAPAGETASVAAMRAMTTAATPIRIRVIVVAAPMVLPYLQNAWPSAVAPPPETRGTATTVATLAVS